MSGVQRRVCKQGDSKAEGKEYYYSPLQPWNRTWIEFRQTKVMIWRCAEDHQLTSEFSKKALRRTFSSKATQSTVHSCVMRGLCSQRCPRLLLRRQWTCIICLQSQNFFYSSSLASTLSGPPSKEHLDATPLEPPPTESIVRKNKAEVNASRGHLKNRGQYYVTTPIFYVNGGIVPWLYSNERRSACRTYAFNDSCRRT